MDLGINFEKSPIHDVCEHSDRSRRRTTIPFAFANYICSKEHLKHKRSGLTTRRNFFRSSFAHQGQIVGTTVGEIEGLTVGVDTQKESF